MVRPSVVLTSLLYFVWENTESRVTVPPYHDTHKFTGLHDTAEQLPSFVVIERMDKGYGAVRGGGARRRQPRRSPDAKTGKDYQRPSFFGASGGEFSLISIFERLCLG